MNGHGFRNTSSPKFTVPQVSEQESGSASRTRSRCSSGSCDRATGAELDDHRGRLAQRRRRCRAAAAGPASGGRRRRGCARAPGRRRPPRSATAVSTSSSRVTGSAGTSALAVSAPVGATVIRVSVREVTGGIVPRPGALAPGPVDRRPVPGGHPGKAARAAQQTGPTCRCHEDARWRPCPHPRRRREPRRACLSTRGRRNSVPEGALLTNTVEAALLDLAESRSTGCLVVRDQEGDEAEVFLRDGQVYAVSVPGRRVMLGVRLMSSGALTPEALAEALEIQRTELQGWRLGELLVHLGYVELAVVEEFVVEHLKDALADLFGWPVARLEVPQEQEDPPGRGAAHRRVDAARRPARPGHHLGADPRRHRRPRRRAAAGLRARPSDDVPLGPNEWALLCKVDGSRSVADLAGECGFTLFEAGQVVARLAEAGLVAVPGVPRSTSRTAGRRSSRSSTSSRSTVEQVEQVEPRSSRRGSRTAASSSRWTRPGPSWCCRWSTAQEAEAREQAEREQAEREQAETAAAAEAASGRSGRSGRGRRGGAPAGGRRRDPGLRREQAAARGGDPAPGAGGAGPARGDGPPGAGRCAAPGPARRRPSAPGARRADAERHEVEEQAWADHAAWLAAQRRSAEQYAWADHVRWLAAERAGVEEPGLGRPRPLARGAAPGRRGAGLGRHER